MDSHSSFMVDVLSRTGTNKALGTARRCRGVPRSCTQLDEFVTAKGEVAQSEADDVTGVGPETGVSAVVSFCA
jgi:hypothetical protein